jgi:hypothetical protein
MAERDAEREPPEAPKPGEVVDADASHVLCRRWNWRQDARRLITPQTRAVPCSGAGDGMAAANDLVDLIGRFSDGTCRVVELDNARRSADIQPARRGTANPVGACPAGLAQSHQIA